MHSGQVGSASTATPSAVSARMESARTGSTFSFKLPGCNATFSHSWNATRHVRSVHGESEKFHCTVPGCMALFAHPWYVKRHIKAVHDGIKAFPCTFPGCKAIFAQQSNVKDHVTAVHDGIKPFPCTVSGCNASFAHRSHVMWCTFHQCKELISTATWTMVENVTNNMLFTLNCRYRFWS